MMFNCRLSKISEVGVRVRQVKRWTSRKPRCIANILSATSITIFEFAPHLIILAFGMFLTMIIFIVEIKLDRKRRQIPVRKKCWQMKNCIDWKKKFNFKIPLKLRFRRK